MELSDRQIEIIGAASRLLTQQGLTGLTIKNLAKEMAFSESAIYRHFSSKEEIILTMLRYLRENMQERLTQAIGESADPTEQLTAVFKNQFDFFAAHNHFLIIILSEGLIEYTESVQQALLSLVLTKKGFIDQIVEAGQHEGIFTQTLSSDFLTHTIMGIFRLLMLKWRMSGFQFDLSVVGQRMIQDVITLLRPS